MLHGGETAPSTRLGEKGCGSGTTDRLLCATASAACGARSKTATGTAGLSLATVTQHAFCDCAGRLPCILVAGSQQECACGPDLPNSTHTTAGAATETSAIATRPAAKLCRKRPGTTELTRLEYSTIFGQRGRRSPQSVIELTRKIARPTVLGAIVDFPCVMSTADSWGISSSFKRSVKSSRFLGIEFLIRFLQSC